MHKTRVYIFITVAVLMLVAQLALLHSSTDPSGVGGEIAMAGTEHGTSAQLPDARPKGHIPEFKSDDDTQSSTHVTGSPAIMPRNLAQAGAKASFTEADIIQYHQTTHGHGVDRYTSTVQPSIVKIEFLTSKALRERVPMADFGLSDDTLLCYVQYAGSFVEQRGKPVSITSDRAMEVFDAKTGNRLAVGMGSWIK